MEGGHRAWKGVAVRNGGSASRAHQGACREVSAATSLAPPGPPASRGPPVPARAPPRGSGAHRAAPAPKCVTGTGSQGEAGTRPGRAGPGEPGGLAGGGPRALLGRPPRRAARQDPAPEVVGRAQPALSLLPPPAPATHFCFLPRGGRGGFLPGKLRGSFPGLRAPPRFSAPLPWAGPPEPGGGGGRPSHGSLTPWPSPCDAVLRPATPRAPRTMPLPGPARPPPAPHPAQHPGPRRQVEPPGQLLRLFYCTVLVCSKEIAALTDFSGKKRPRPCAPGSAARAGEPSCGGTAGLGQVGAHGPALPWCGPLA